MPAAAESFREHALQNAYNSYFHGSFYWGDWDMYWTDHHDDKQNMVLRAVSGGPVYFSDKTGRTKAEHVWPLIYRDGQDYSLRSAWPADSGLSDYRSCS
ncbi:hypothetical protein XYCOK13_33490 [Xylanibacillus composti]|uniref:Uncharacterized protein n=1 Tax=Xylanibacillus composti TaxID=1572762 RepID=A0A8J4H6D2_9BACL|nr:Sip1-related alpha-galactosidase [Xylanibacillus composti]GIQ70525.1 hypothetical protein XYCOK13_33490 [Xylanibacillus composti]